MNPEFINPDLETEVKEEENRKIIAELVDAVRNPSKYTGIKLNNVLLKVAFAYRDNPELRQDIMLRAQQNPNIYDKLDEVIKNLDIKETFDNLWQQIERDQA